MKDPFQKIVVTCQRRLDEMLRVQHENDYSKTAFKAENKVLSE